MTKKRKATGVLGEMLQNIDKIEFEKVKNRMIIAAKISDSLLQKGMNQKEFAAIMGRTESEISEWLSGNRNFTIDTLTEISLALGVSLIDTSSSTAYTVPMYCLMTSEVKKSDIGFAGSAKWNYPIGHDGVVSERRHEVVSKGQKAV